MLKQFTLPNLDDVKHLASALLLAVLIVGCNRGTAKLRYAGGGEEAFASNAGGVATIDVYDDSDESMGIRHVLRVVTVGPSAEAVLSQRNEVSAAGPIITKSNEWNTPSGKLTCSANWDMSSDGLTCGTNLFNRNNGNVLLLVCTNGQSLVARQLGSVPETANAAEVLQFVRTNLPNDKLIQSLKLQRGSK